MSGQRQQRHFAFAPWQRKAAAAAQQPEVRIVPWKHVDSRISDDKQFFVDPADCRVLGHPPGIEPQALFRLAVQWPLNLEQLAENHEGQC